MNARTPSPWRQPVVWLVIALPALSVIGGVSMLFLSDAPPDAVADPVKRTAQVQQTDLSRDVEAQRLGLVARVRRTGDTIDVAAVGPGLDRAVPLELILRHPVRASEDRTVALVSSGGGWSARVAALDDAHDWILELAPTDRRWRLVGRWKTDAQDATLRPALDRAP